MAKKKRSERLASLKYCVRELVEQSEYLTKMCSFLPALHAHCTLYSYTSVSKYSHLFRDSFLNYSLTSDLFLTISNPTPFKNCFCPK